MQTAATVLQTQLKRAHEAHLNGNLKEAEMLYQGLLNADFENPKLLYLLGNLYAQRGFNGMAINLLRMCLDIMPEFQEAWIDLGVALKGEHRDDMALLAWSRAESLGQHAEVFINRATLYADSGKPDLAIADCDRALAMDSQRPQPHWNKALALLTKQDWANAWDEHEWRKKLPNIWNERTAIDAPEWDGKPVKSLFIHGEQGKGDEIMYLSMLPDVMALAEQIVVEVNEAVAPLVRITWPEISVVTTMDEGAALGPFDAKIAMGSLGRLFRRDKADFPGTPYLQADPERVEHYRQELSRLGSGPHIGIAWIGGTKTTRIHKRTISLGRLAPLLKGNLAVSLQYGDFGEPEAVQFGIACLGKASNGTDLAEQAALISALDYVVTVQQTVVHLAGALGVPTYVLTCEAPSWRYGAAETGDRMPWYKNTRLIRQTEGESWDTVIARAAQIIGQQTEQVAA